MGALIDLSDNASLIGLLFTVLYALIVVVGFYLYFQKEKELRILLIALGFLFFFIASLNSVISLFEDLLINPWAPVWNFLGALVIFISIEPWEMFGSKGP